MKVIILCGGRGTRLGETTIPKALMRVGDKPLIWHIMKQYAKFGYTEFILALGYLGDQIKQHFLLNESYSQDFTLHPYGTVERHGEDDGFTITFADTGLDTLPGERIRRCGKYIREDHFMVTYCDGVSDINIGELVEWHKKGEYVGTITLVHPHSKWGTVKTDPTGLIESFQEKPVLDSYVNGGFMVFKREALNYIKPMLQGGDMGEMEHEMLKRIIAERRLSYFKHTGFWMAVDTRKELEELNRFYEAKLHCKKLLWHS